MKIIPFVLAKFGFGNSDMMPGGYPQPVRFLWMKRATFIFTVLFALWALFSPKTLAAYLWQAEAIIPEWFYSMLATVFAGVWM